MKYILLSFSIWHSNNSGFLKVWPINKNHLSKYRTGNIFHCLKKREVTVTNFNTFKLFLKKIFELFLQ